MKNIIPITDLQRQAGQIISNLSVENEPVYITQRGRAAAVIINADRYAEIEEDLKRLDEFELLEMVELSRRQVRDGNTISHSEVKQRLKQSRKK